MPRNGWEGGTYNNNNDHNVLMLCTRSCEAEGIEHPPGYGGLASARCLGTAGNHRDIASTNQQLSQLCRTNITTTISGINVQGDDAQRRVIPPKAFCQFARAHCCAAANDALYPYREATQVSLIQSMTVQRIHRQARLC